MVNLSNAQKKILARFEDLPGATLIFDQKIGRYRFYHLDRVIDVDQRPIYVLLDKGVLEKSNLGQCYPAVDAPWNKFVE